MAVPFYGDFDLTETIDIPFNTFSSDDPAASVTITNFVAGDVYVHKAGTEGTPTGITVSLNVGTVNGNHLAHLDLSNTNDAGFYANGSLYQVRIEGVTVDAGTLNSWIGSFSIGRTLRPATAGRTLVVDANGLADANMVKAGPTGSGTAQTTGDLAKAVITDAAGTNIAADIIVVKSTVDNIESGVGIIVQDTADMQPIVERLAYMGPQGLGVWCDDAAGNTNTVLGTDGTEDNPVSTLGAARTLADALGSKTYYLEGGSSFTLGATHEDWLFVGHGDADSNTINLGAAASATDVDRSEFINLTVVGTQGGAERIALGRCVIDDAPTAEVTTLHCLATFCDLQGNFKIDSSSDNVFADCYSGVAGNGTPVLTFTGASGDLEFRRYSGGIELKSAGASHTASMDFASGHLVINADVNVNASIIWRGISHITDNTGGLNSLTRTGALSIVEILNTSASSFTVASTLGAIINDLENGGRLNLLIDAIKTVTDKFVFTIANEVDSNVLNVATNALDADGLSTDAVNEIADGLLARVMTEGYATDGSTATVAQMFYMLWSALSEFAIATTTITAKKLDGSTTAMTFTLDDATNPTSRTRAT